MALNCGPEAACPTFRLGKIDDGKLQTAANLISQLVSGAVIQPGEGWIREYLGIPAAVASAEDK